MKNIFLILIFSMLIFIGGNQIPVNILSYITADLTICNNTKHRIHNIHSEYFFSYGIEKGECRKVDKKKILLEYMPYNVQINKEGEIPVIYEKMGGFDPGGLNPIKYYLNQALWVKDKTISIESLINDENTNSIKTVGRVKHNYD